MHDSIFAPWAGCDFYHIQTGRHAVLFPAAKAIGIELSATLLTRADEVIELLGTCLLRRMSQLMARSSGKQCPLQCRLLGVKRTRYARTEFFRS